MKLIKPISILLVSIFLIMPIISFNSFSENGDDHLIDVEGDTDGDYLTDEEEEASGYDPENPDENDNNILDGVELAQRMENSVGHDGHFSSKYFAKKYFGDPHNISGEFEEKVKQLFGKKTH